MANTTTSTEQTEAAVPTPIPTSRGKRTPEETLEHFFAAVFADELAWIAFRRDYFSEDSYPFQDREAAERAWLKAQKQGEAARKHCLEKMQACSLEDLPEKDQRQVRQRENDARRATWQNEWEQAERDELHQRQRRRDGAKVQLEERQKNLGQPELNEEQRKALERQVRECADQYQGADEEVRLWQQEIDTRARRKQEQSDIAQQAKQLLLDRATLARKSGLCPCEREKEKQALDRREETLLQQVRNTAHDLELVGLAFSGGGIRSATFNLGLLQGLADLDLLKCVDYLSTVSGGGYIGGWLSAWLHREGGLSKVARQLRTGQTTPSVSADSGESVEPAPLRHLRRHSNYLAPRQGFLSADVWVLWATYLRNFLLNQLVLLPATIAVLLLVRGFMLLYYPWSPNVDAPDEGSIWLMGIFTRVTGVLWFATFVLLFWSSFNVLPRPGTTPDGAGTRLAPGWLLVLALLLLAGAVLFCSIAPYPLLITTHGHHAGSWMAWMEFALPCAVLAGLAFLLAALLRWLIVGIAWRRVFRASLVVFASGFLAGLLLYGVYHLLNSLYRWNGMLALDYVEVRATAQVMTVGPPLVLLALVLAIYAGVGLSKGQLKEGLREWWSSVCARLLALAAVWLGVNLVALYATPLLLWAGPWVGTALGSGWMMTVAGGVLAGKGPNTGDRSSNRYPEWLARIAPYVFVIGLLIGVSLLLHFFLDCPPLWREADDRVWLRQSLPARPPNRVILSRTTKDGASTVQHERQEITEHAETIEDGLLVQRMYWLGILNTDPHFVPRFEGYQLTDKDHQTLCDEHHYSPELQHALEPLIWHDRQALGQVARTVGLLGAPLGQGPLLTAAALPPGCDHSFPNQEQFETELNRVLPPDTPDADRAMIVQHAKKVQWMYQGDDWKYHLFTKLAIWFGSCIALLLVAMGRVDVNFFSLHALYGNRLIRAYLGASRTRSTEARPAPRWPDPVTGLDPKDDLPLESLSALPYGPESNRQGHDGPYLLVNTALNLVHGEELAWQERKAEAFVLSPFYCGSATTGYRLTKDGYDANVSLGNAVTLSGAAASPNMGYHSSPAVTVLLTVFNARLGAWVGNPKNRKHWKRHGPWFGYFHLFRELFGWTNDTDGYVYLSDGGHFENLGVYELVRRRCRFIIVSDAGQDGGHAFEDLGNLIRKCRIDFGIRIEIDLDALHLQEQTRRCRWHCAIGKVRYDDVDARAAVGTLVYIKPSLTGDEPADVLHYAGSHPTFPHESTGNQFYSESQFESYRALGHHIAQAVFEQSVADLQEEIGPDGEMPGDGRRRRCRGLFASVVRRWFAMPPEFEAAFVHSTQEFIEIQKAIREDPRLWRLTFDLYPEWKPDEQQLKALEGAETQEQKIARQRAELHITTHMLQVMENAWLSLNLDVNYAHPLNRGWMDIFHRWTGAATVRRLWPVLRAEFARGFVSFCEKQMRLGVVVGTPILLKDAPLTQQQRERLCLEFEDQWPDVKPQIEERLQQAQANRDHWAWLVYASNPYPGQKEVEPDAMPCGIIHIARDDTALANGRDVYDFFVWMRGAYRNTGLGRTAVRTVLNDFPSLVRSPFRLRVRLPVKDLTGPGGKLQKSMWLTFFQHQDFILVAPLSADKEIVMERAFGELSSSPKDAGK